MNANSTPRTETPPIRVAVVDDSDEVRFLLSTMMEMDGRFEIVGEAEDAATGVVLVADVDPELVLIDLFLGRRDGTWLVKKLRQQDHDVALAVITGSDDAGDYAAALESGADSVHSKTSMITTLANELAESVARHRATSAA